MDGFEREYFTKLNQLSADYQLVMRNLAKSRIKMFAAALYRQLIDEKESFDLIVSAGNSGLYMIQIAKIVFENLGLEIPKQVTLPIYRFKQEGEKVVLNDNSSLKDSVKGKINLPNQANILFIDDEIMKGLTVKAALEIILAELPDLEKIRCVIIAENHFFEWHHKLPKVSVNFFAYSRLIQGLNGIIGYFIPEDLYSKIISLFEDVESYNHAMAIVIGGALKRRDNNENAFYDKEVEKLCSETIENFTMTQQTLKAELEELVKTGIEQYKSKEIQFRF